MGWGRGGIQDVRAALGGEGRRPRPRGIGTPCPPLGRGAAPGESARCEQVDFSRAPLGQA